MIRSALLALVLIGPLAVTACSQDEGNILTVEDAYARESIGNAQNGAAYFSIHNRTGADDVLTGAASPVATSTELHTHEVEGDVMRMRRVDTVAVPEGEDVLFEPGGKHVMFIGLKQPLKAGDIVPLTLTFENAGEIAVEVSVVALGGGMPEGMSEDEMPEDMDHGMDGMDHGGSGN